MLFNMCVDCLSCYKIWIWIWIWYLRYCEFCTLQLLGDNTCYEELCVEMWT